MIIKTSNAKSLIEQIRIWRKSKKLTQKQFANLVGVHWQTVGNWENGRQSPTIEQLIDTIKLITKLEQKDCSVLLERKYKENV